MLLHVVGGEVVPPDDADLVLEPLAVRLLDDRDPRELGAVRLSFLGGRVGPDLGELLQELVHPQYREGRDLGLVRVIDPAGDIAVRVHGPRGIDEVQ